MTAKGVRSSIALIVCAVLMGSASTTGRAEDRHILVFAAASLKNALDEAASRYARATGVAVKVSYAASSALAKQIEAGAPADVYISADLDWMDYLSERDLIAADSRRNLLGNGLVLIARADDPLTLTIAPGFPLAATLGDGRLAMANTDAVPAGKYGKAALKALGVWSSVEGRIAQADTVRTALALVSRGEAPLGIVYRTDAVADTSVVVAGTFPADTYPPIVYPAALVAASAEGQATAFVAFLSGAEARDAFETQGFTILSGNAEY